MSQKVTSFSHNRASVQGLDGIVPLAQRLYGKSYSLGKIIIGEPKRIFASITRAGIMSGVKWTKFKTCP